MRVLLVEDHKATAETTAMMLSTCSYVCDTATLGEDGLEIAKLYDYDIILLDLMLPDMDGFEVLRQLRMAKVQTPVLILSAIAEVGSRIKGFGHGADGYLVKPVDRRELLARIQSIVRRAKGHCDSVIQIGKLGIDIGRRMAMVDGVPLHFTDKEYAILELLALRRGSVQSKDVVMNHLYGGAEEPGYKVIDVFVCKLRRKLIAACGEDYIETHWGRGYALKVPGEKDDAGREQAAA